MSGALSMSNDASAEGFSHEMQQTAVAWRLMSSSDPAIENPLLAGITEFWFNHLNVFVGKGAARPFVGNYAFNVIRPLHWASLKICCWPARAIQPCCLI